MLLAWLRASFVVTGLVAALVLTTQVLLERPATVLAQTASVLLAVGLGYWCSYQFDRPDLAAVAAVLQRAGVPADVVERVAGYGAEGRGARS